MAGAIIRCGHQKENHNIRIIAGSIKGRKLTAPKGLGLRPTPEKVRGALFNILADRVVSSRFLDLYAGTGAVGIEALSRGATAVDFVEINREHLIALKQNLRLWPSEENRHLFEGSAAEFLKRIKEPFDLVFIDPPYRSDEIEKMLPTLEQGDIIRPHGMVVFEHFFKRILPQKIGAFHLTKQSRYGETVLSFYGTS